MRTLARLLRHFCVADDGPTSVEYAILLTIILAVALSIRSVGQRAQFAFTNASMSLGRNAAS